MNTKSNYEKLLTWWRSNKLETIDDYYCVLDNYNTLFIMNSAKIEGSKLGYHTTREIYEDGELSYIGNENLSHLMEAVNHKAAMDFILENIIKKTPITKEFILQLHGILLRGCYDKHRWNVGERPGTFKKNDYCVGTGSIGSYPDEVEDNIDEVLESLNDSSASADPLTAAAFLHLSIENIHPFADGNGRLGRLLMNYYLMLNGYPPIIVFNEDKGTYYLALEVFDRVGTISGFIMFMQEQTVKTWGRKLRFIDRNKKGD